MALAIFDLDNTLIAGDSDHAWGEFLVEQKVVDPEAYKRANDTFYEDYKRGQLDIYAYLEFALAPLTQHPNETLLNWREQFVEQKVRPMLLEKAKATVKMHRDRGDFIMIITATNSFVTEPIAKLYEVDLLLATDPEVQDGKYTGKVAGTPCYQEGKVTRLKAWLDGQELSLEGAYFYSDSHNDLPLMSLVENPVAIDADEVLTTHAEKHGWQIQSFR